MAGVLRQPLRLSSMAPLADPAMLAARAVLFSSAQSSSQLGRGHQQIRNAVTSSKSRSRKANAPTPSSMARPPVTTAMITFRIPQTFAPPKWSKYFNEPGTLIKLLYYRTRQRFQDKAAEISLRLTSKRGFFKKAAFQPIKTAQFLPMAKAMHIQMLESIADGDMAGLRDILTIGHYNEVGALLERRPSGRRCQWELLSYQGSPKVVDRKLMMIPGGGGVYMQQAVVQIRSRQRFTWTTESPTNRRRGTAPAAPPAPTVTEKDVTENIIFVATVDRRTWETSEYRIFGFMPETDLQEWASEKKLLQDMISSL